MKFNDLDFKNGIAKHTFETGLRITVEAAIPGDINHPHPIIKVFNIAENTEIPLTTGMLGDFGHTEEEITSIIKQCENYDLKSDK